MYEHEKTHGLYIKTHNSDPQWLIKFVGYIDDLYSSFDTTAPSKWEITHCKAGNIEAAKHFNKTIIVDYNEININKVASTYNSRDAIAIESSDKPYQFLVQYCFGVTSTIREPDDWPELRIVLPWNSDQSLHLHNSLFLLDMVHRFQIYSLNYFVTANYWDFIHLWPLSYERRKRRNGQLTGPCDCRKCILGVSHLFTIPGTMLTYLDAEKRVSKLKNWECCWIDYAGPGKGATCFKCTQIQTPMSEEAQLEIEESLLDLHP